MRSIVSPLDERLPFPSMKLDANAFSISTVRHWMVSLMTNILFSHLVIFLKRTLPGTVKYEPSLSLKMKFASRISLPFFSSTKSASPV